LVEEAGKESGIPVIASINCMTSSDWVSFAKEIEDAGAKALELNIYVLPLDKDKPSAEYENKYYDILERVSEIVKIPVSVKIGNNFSNPAYFINQLYFRGAKAVVLFNRFYEPDIDVNKLQITTAPVFSNPDELRHVLRWVGILSHEVKNIDIAASTGIHDGVSAVKQILAGAKVVQICSVLYKKGIDHLPLLIEDFIKWMKDKEFNSPDEFRGMLNYGRIAEPVLYERAQFMKHFSDFH